MLAEATCGSTWVINLACGGDQFFASRSMAHAVTNILRATAMMACFFRDLEPRRTRSYKSLKCGLNRIAHQAYLANTPIQYIPQRVFAACQDGSRYRIWTTRFYQRHILRLEPSGLIEWRFELQWLAIAAFYDSRPVAGIADAQVRVHAQSRSRCFLAIWASLRASSLSVLRFTFPHCQASPPG